MKHIDKLIKHEIIMFENVCQSTNDKLTKKCKESESFANGITIAGIALMVVIVLL